MTRYLFGIFAVAFVFSAVAFKTPEKKFANNIFRFSGNVNDQTQVQNRTYWDYVGSSLICPGNTNVKACEIETPETVMPDGNDNLPAGYSITATKVGGGTSYYVSSVPSGSFIHNTTNP